ncbi:HAD family hydrolase [Brucella sp. 22210]|uniref:HAD family hydrolase n=1 Tax=Brucella sp. 22210 TaxID=3453892 RepID=UPI003F82471A
MGHLKAVVFDWAGTVIDFGSFAPMGVFVEAFAQFGIEVSIAEAREPMGRPKWDHIEAMLAQPRIHAAWEAHHGHAPTQADIQAVYDVFVPLNEQVVDQYADLVPGAVETARALRERGLKIGSTTGSPARSWSASCRLPRRKGMKPTIWSAPEICRTDAQLR